MAINVLTPNLAYTVLHERPIHCRVDYDSEVSTRYTEITTGCTLSYYSFGEYQVRILCEPL